MVLFTPRPLEDGDKNKSPFLNVQKFEEYICIWIYCILLTFREAFKKKKQKNFDKCQWVKGIILRHFYY